MKVQFRSLKVGDRFLPVNKRVGVVISTDVLRKVLHEPHSRNTAKVEGRGQYVQMEGGDLVEKLVSLNEGDKA